MGRWVDVVNQNDVRQSGIIECENTFLKIYLPSAKKHKLPYQKVFGVFAIEVNKTLQGTPSKLRREMGMYGSTIYAQHQHSSIIRHEYSLYVLQSRVSRSRCSIYLVPGTVHAATQQTLQIRGTVVSLARKNSCEQGVPHYTYVLQAEQRLPHATEEKAKCSFPMERGPTAKHYPAWNPQGTQ